MCFVSAFFFIFSEVLLEDHWKWRLWGFLDWMCLSIDYSYESYDGDTKFPVEIGKFFVFSSLLPPILPYPYPFQLLLLSFPSLYLIQLFVLYPI